MNTAAPRTQAPALSVSDTPLNADRVICSSITLRHLPLDQALATISAVGFSEIDLGALPGVCNHVPYDLTRAAVADVSATVRDSGLGVRSINADIGDLNRPLDKTEAARRHEHLDRLVELCTAVDSHGLVLPNGALSHDPITSLDADLDLVVAQLDQVSQTTNAAGIELWVEAPHFFRLCYDLERTERLLATLPDSVGLICDVSHIVASGATPRRFVDLAGARIRHVHLRDAEPGYIHHSIGRGQVDFPDTLAALADIGYRGKFSLELETRDVSDDQRPTGALQAGRYISALLAGQVDQPPVRRRSPAARPPASTSTPTASTPSASRFSSVVGAGGRAAAPTMEGDRR